MKKLILSLIVLLVVVTVVSACQNKANYNDDKINNSTTADHSKEGDSRKNENYKINNQSNNDKPNLKDVEKWKKFNEKDFNFLKKLFDKLGYDTKVIYDEEKEDIGLLKAMLEEKKGEYVSEEEIMKALGKK